MAPSGPMVGGTVVVEGRRIASLIGGPAEPPSDVAVIDASGLYVAPGLIDTHTHGLNGSDAMDGEAGVRGMSLGHAERGVTGFLPTLVGQSRDRLTALVAEAASAEVEGAGVLGIHLEGPYLDPSMPGMFDPATFRPYDDTEARDLVDAAGGLTVVMTVACHGQRVAAAKGLIALGVIPSLGHAAGTYDEAMLAFESGVARATHCFNAMTGFHHREPGIIGAVLDRREVAAELILDGHHVHPGAASLLLSLKGTERTILVTDSTVLTGYPDGTHEWAGYEISIRDGSARIPEGNLAGSLLTMDQAVRNAVEMLGVTFEEAIEMASLTPARSAGIERQTGSLAPGKDADITVFDRELCPFTTMVKGEVAWSLGGNSP